MILRGRRSGGVVLSSRRCSRCLRGCGGWVWVACLRGDIGNLFSQRRRRIGLGSCRSRCTSGGCRLRRRRRICCRMLELVVLVVSACSFGRCCPGGISRPSSRAEDVLGYVLNGGLYTDQRMPDSNVLNVRILLPYSGYGLFQAFPETLRMCLKVRPSSSFLILVRMILKQVSKYIIDFEYAVTYH